MGTTYVSRELKAIKDNLALTADTTLSVDDSGKTIFLDAVGEAITLPAPIAGVNYKFVCSATTATSD